MKILSSLKLTHLSDSVRRNFHIDCISAAFQGVFTAAVFPFAAVIAIRLGASAWLVSLLVASAYLAQALIIPAAAIMGGRKKLPFLVWMNFIGKSIIVWMAFVVEPVSFVLVVILYQLTENFGNPAYVSLVHVMYPQKVRGKLVSVAWTVAYSASMFSTFAAGYFLDMFSYRAVFPIAAFVGMISTTIFMRIRVDEHVEIRRSHESLFHIFSILRKDSRFFRYLLGLSVADVGYLLMLPIFPMFLVNSLDVSNFEMGVLVSIQSAFTIVTMMLWGRHIDRRGAFRTMVYCMAFLVPSPFVFFLSDSIYTVWLAFVLMGIGLGGLGISVVNLMGLFAAPHRITDYYSLNQTVVGVKGLIVPFIAALLLVYFPIKVAFLICFVALVIGVSFFATMGRSFLSETTK